MRVTNHTSHNHTSHAVKVHLVPTFRKPHACICHVPRIWRGFFTFRSKFDATIRLYASLVEGQLAIAEQNPGRVAWNEPDTVPKNVSRSLRPVCSCSSSGRWGTGIVTGMGKFTCPFTYSRAKGFWDSHWDHPISTVDPLAVLAVYQTERAGKPLAWRKVCIVHMYCGPRCERGSGLLHL